MRPMTVQDLDPLFNWIGGGRGKSIIQAENEDGQPVYLSMDAVEGDTGDIGIMGIVVAGDSYSNSGPMNVNDEKKQELLDNLNRQFGPLQYVDIAWGMDIYPDEEGVIAPEYEHMAPIAAMLKAAIDGEYVMLSLGV